MRQLRVRQRKLAAPLLPFEVGSQTRLSGDIGTETSVAVPAFTVTVARRVGQ
jgi:hypothetical protein